MGMTIIANDGTRLGTVADLLFDDACRRVVGFVLRSGYVFRTRQVVGFSEVQAISTTAIIVTRLTPRRPSADEVAALSTDHRSMQGKRVMTRDGRHIGAFRDVLFDESSGRIVGFEVSEPRTAGPHRLSGPRLPAALTNVIADGVIIPETRKR